MKRLYIFFVFLVLLGFLSACNEGIETKVKVIDVTYNTNEAISNKTITLKGSQARNMSVVFPGDIITITVIIEDPDYEFVSLLSIQINDTIIRANTEDTIASTRDCGVNICVDIPYEVELGVYTYSVNALKFVKLGLTESVDAIIDNTNNFIELAIHESSVSPYIEDAVVLLNEMYQSLIFYDNYSITESSVWDSLYNESERRVIILNFDDVTFYENQVLPSGFSGLDMLSDWFYAGNEQLGSHPQHIGVTADGFMIQGIPEAIVYYPSIYLYVYDTIYESLYFSHEGNTIYVNTQGASLKLMTFGLKTQLVRLENSHKTYI